MKEVIQTTKAPGAIGPYSQAVRLGDFLFASGQVPINPADGSIPAGIEAQTKQALANVKGILDEVGLTPANVVKTTVFLKDMEHFAAMNEIYADFFQGTVFPARSAVEVARLPKDVLVEVEIIASFQ